MAHQPTRGSQAGYQAATTLDYVSLAGSTEGYAASDLNDLVQGSVQQAMMRLARSTTAAVSDNHLTIVESVAKPAALDTAPGRLCPGSSCLYTDQLARRDTAKVGCKMGGHRRCVLLRSDRSAPPKEADPMEVSVKHVECCERRWNGRRNTPRSTPTVPSGWHLGQCLRSDSCSRSTIS